MTMLDNLKMEINDLIWEDTCKRLAAKLEETYPDFPRLTEDGVYPYSLGWPALRHLNENTEFGDWLRGFEIVSNIIRNYRLFSRWHEELPPEIAYVLNMTINIYEDYKIDHATIEILADKTDDRPQALKTFKVWMVAVPLFVKYDRREVEE